MLKVISINKVKLEGVNVINITFSKDGDLVPVAISENDESKLFTQVVDMIKSFNSKEIDMDTFVIELFETTTPLIRYERSIEGAGVYAKSFKVRENGVYFEDHKLDRVLEQYVLSLIDEDMEVTDKRMWSALSRFIDNLYQNVNSDVRSQLTRWFNFELNNPDGMPFAITEDGCLIGYRGNNGTVLEPVSVHKGYAIVDGVEMNDHIPNRLGSVIEMPRSAVEYDPDTSCAPGLHIGSFAYASTWAPILTKVKFNPRDVVSVPYESDSQKIRVCRFEVLEVVDNTDNYKPERVYVSDSWNCNDEDFEVETYVYLNYTKRNGVTNHYEGVIEMVDYDRIGVDTENGYRHFLYSGINDFVTETIEEHNEAYEEDLEEEEVIGEVVFIVYRDETGVVRSVVGTQVVADKDNYYFTSEDQRFSLSKESIIRHHEFKEILTR